VDTVEIANGQGALGRQLRVLVATENFHATDYRFYGATARLIEVERQETAEKAVFTPFSRFHCILIH